MPEEHAFLSASGAHRWINCTPSAALEKQFPDTAGSYAAEGTLAHSLAELKLRKQFEIMKPSAYKQRLAEIQSDELYQREMDGYTDAYVDYIRSLCMAFAGTPYVVVEKRLDFSQIVPGGFGTGDCVILYDAAHRRPEIRERCGSVGGEQPAAAAVCPRCRAGVQSAVHDQTGADAHCTATARQHLHR